MEEFKWERDKLKELIGDLNSMMDSSHRLAYEELNGLSPLDESLYYEILRELQSEEDSWWRGQDWRQRPIDKNLKNLMDIVDNAQTMDTKTMKIMKDRMAKIDSGEMKVIFKGKQQGFTYKKDKE
jgi:hypothetical protein